MRLTALSVATALLAGCSTTSIKNVPAAAAFSAAKAPYGFMSSDPMFQFAGLGRARWRVTAVRTLWLELEAK
jgi:hypothetical protein